MSEVDAVGENVAGDIDGVAAAVEACHVVRPVGGVPRGWLDHGAGVRACHPPERVDLPLIPGHEQQGGENPVTLLSVQRVRAEAHW